MKMVCCLIVGRGGKSTRDKGLIFFSSSLNGQEAEKLSKKVRPQWISAISRDGNRSVTKSRLPGGLENKPSEKHDRR